MKPISGKSWGAFLDGYGGEKAPQRFMLRGGFLTQGSS
jgi:hypothetical protein